MFMLVELPARSSSDSCLCLEAASCTMPRLVCNWLRSPPLVRPSSFELMSSSGRSCSRSKREPKSVPSLLEPDRAGELSLGLLADGGPCSTTFSAILGQMVQFSYSERMGVTPAEDLLEESGGAFTKALLCALYNF